MSILCFQLLAIPSDDSIKVRTFSDSRYTILLFCFFFSIFSNFSQIWWNSFHLGFIYFNFSRRIYFGKRAHKGNYLVIFYFFFNHHVMMSLKASLYFSFYQPISNVCWSSCGKYLVSTTMNGEIFCWNTSTKKCIKKYVFISTIFYFIYLHLMTLWIFECSSSLNIKYRNF